MQAHLLLWKAICYDLTVYVLGYIYFLEDIHPQALEHICCVMNLSHHHQLLKMSSYFRVVSRRF